MCLGEAVEEACHSSPNRRRRGRGRDDDDDDVDDDDEIKEDDKDEGREGSGGSRPAARSMRLLLQCGEDPNERTPLHPPFRLKQRVAL